MTYQKVYRNEDLWEGEMLEVLVERERILLARIDNQVVAYKNKCCHLGMPLHQGHLRGHVLTCFAHHWQYDIRSGVGVNPKSVHLIKYPVKIEDDFIWIEPTPIKEESHELTT